MLHHIFYTNKILSIIFFSFCLFLTAGCSLGGGSEVGNPESTSPFGIPDSMTQFAGSDELETYLKEQYATNVDAYSGTDQFLLDGGPFPESNDTTTGAAGGGYTQTNVQELGVDEADQVKTDGDYLYVAGQNIVSVVHAVPADSMNIVSTIDVRGSVYSLYLYNDILVVLYVLGNEYGEYAAYDLIGPADALEPYYIHIKIKTGIMMVDVSVPANPETIMNTTIDGGLVSSRVTGGKLHIVQQFYPDLPPLQLSYDYSQQTIQQVIAANYEALSSIAINDLLPSYEKLDSTGSVIETGLIVAPTSFYIPNKPCGGSMTAIVTYNLDDLTQPFQSIGIVADAHNIYASTRSLYLTACQYSSGTQTDNNIDYHYQTVIHKFDLSGHEVTWAGSGGVKGTALNQFSLGEYDGVLRIATNTGNTWGSSPTALNHVFCLKIREQKLEIIGRLEDLAPGERIYAARFIGRRGFLVTFVKVDPLFTLDISDPTAPRVVGELKVPGYSDYIHPLGENHLMTIGKDAKEQEGTTYYQGVQLSIFDITDFADPRLLYKELIGDRGTESEALHNHKAFTYWDQFNLLAIPISLYEHEVNPVNKWEYGSHTFTGLYVYRAEASTGFEFLGRIETSAQPYYYYNSSWLRGIFIETDVYAVQTDAVRSANVDDIANTINTLYLDTP